MTHYHLFHQAGGPGTSPESCTTYDTLEEVQEALLTEFHLITDHLEGEQETTTITASGNTIHTIGKYQLDTDGLIITSLDPWHLGITYVEPCDDDACECYPEGY